MSEGDTAMAFAVMMAAGIAACVRYMVMVLLCIIDDAFGPVPEPEPYELLNIGHSLRAARLRRLTEWCDATQWELRMSDARYEFENRPNNPLAYGAMPRYGTMAA